ncbi:2OG-Fe(II) oxygenase [Ancylomarina sp.]|uniref:2OG-Fe(II) oxygenase n=1 Tax=Ancylomarina sp. TaxID=1970196 RepID=UPI0035650254
MQKAYEEIVNSFIDDKVGLSQSFLSDALATQLRENLRSLNFSERLQAAGIGNQAKLVTDLTNRGDKIYWLDRSHKDEHENRFFDLMDEFVSYLNSSCYTGITGYEFHYALYEKGTFYKKHLDQFHDNKSRAFTMIMYLNVDWKEEDGGNLCIFHENRSQIINPVNGSCVFFKSSELEHEVLPCNQQRLSITGWLKTN